MSASVRVVFKWLHLPRISKQTSGYNSPHDWLMRLAMDLAAFKIIGNSSSYIHSIVGA